MRQIPTINVTCGQALARAAAQPVQALRPKRLVERRARRHLRILFIDLNDLWQRVLRPRLSPE